ncbi:MAG: ABC transporter substrate-binding protein [Anaerolineaceae bacterium]|nr:ABC transporter substrate-binding protein [Anaerolineaceae bacterium]
MNGDLVGRRLGKYEIRAEVGRGGMGTVYLAHDPLLQRRVALKVLAPHLAGEPDLIERFLREARAAARLKHPNIVTIYDVGQEGSTYYFVMEYVDGPSLARALAQRGPMSPGGALRLLRPLASALDYAHGQELVHRDVKPGNILLDPRGEPALGDFGIARAAQDSRLTTTGTLVGTPEYMSPEQARGDEVDHRTDLYSLAIVAYEMLGGRSPFAGTTPHGVLYRQVHEAPPPLRQPRPGDPAWPAAVDGVLQKALAKEPGQRYETAGAFVEALARALGAAQPAAGQGTVVPAPVAGAHRPPMEDEATVLAGGAVQASPAAGDRDPERTVAAPRPFPPGQAVARPQEPRRRTWPWLALGLLLVVAAAALALALLPGDGQPGPQAGAPGPAATATLPAAPPPATAAAGRACDAPDGCVELAGSQPILLGYLLVVAGPDAALGIDTWRGLELALAERREIRGHPVELRGEDGGCTAEGGLVAANELARDPNLVAVVGTSCSNEAREAIPVLCRAGIPLVSPSNTAVELTAPDRPADYWCYLRTAYNDAAQGVAAAHFAREALGLSRAATIHDGSSYSLQLQEVFAREFELLGGTVTAREAVTPREPAARQVLAALARTEPQVLYYPVFVESGAPLTQEARRVEGLRQVALLGSDGLFSPDFLQAAGEAARGFYWTSPDLAAFDAGYQALAERYEQQYREMPIGPYHAHAYDAANLILSAIERVAVEGPGGSLLIPRRALVEALFATRDFPGITGRLTCSPTGDCADPKIAVYEGVDVNPARWDPGQGAGHNPVKIWP